ncbi:hypothetical protein K402DRAFT_398707 [Aulographum hederae CBS 113979]|uniref:Uncharacterized protein n=1 Tax=Aulographum hederae CBS 113979 TaxID=1176131 RepID=A0A6G1GJZ9_9PEZI|nr:hypothetical protein K402DRAFT_398707 [Aulographum hederae CBS 113979]
MPTANPPPIDRASQVKIPPESESESAFPVSYIVPIFPHPIRPALSKPSSIITSGPIANTTPLSIYTHTYSHYHHRFPYLPLNPHRLSS